MSRVWSGAGADIMASGEGVSLQRFLDMVRDAGLVGGGLAQVSHHQATKACLDSKLVDIRAKGFAKLSVLELREAVTRIAHMCAPDLLKWPPPLPSTFELTENWLDPFGR